MIGVSLRKVYLKQIFLIWKQGLILVLTFVLCALGFIAVIRPLKILNEQIEEDKAKIFPGYYTLMCNNLNSSDLDFIERDLSELTGKCMVICQKEIDVDLLNFKGHGNVIALTESQFRELDNTYGNNQYVLYKLLSGKIPNTDTEVLALDYMYSDWEFDSSAEKKIEKTAVLPELGECVTTGVVTSSNSLEYPVNLKWGFIVTQEAFDQTSFSNHIMLYVFVDNSLKPEEETNLRSVISNYAEIEDATYNENKIDTSGDEAALTLAVELSCLVIIAIVLGEIIVISDFLKGYIGINNIYSQLGLSKRGCCILSLMPIVIFLVIAEIFLIIFLKLAEKHDVVGFLNIGHPYDWLVLLFHCIIVFISAICIYCLLKRKECR